MGEFLNAPVIVRPLFRSTLPATVGLNAILISQLPPAGTPVAQLVMPLIKGALTRMFVIGIANEPDWLKSVTVCVGLVRPTISSPKASGGFGLTFSFGCFTSGDDATSDCASAGRASPVSRTSDRKARPKIDRMNDLNRISKFPPHRDNGHQPCVALRAFNWHGPRTTGLRVRTGAKVSHIMQICQANNYAVFNNQ